MRDQQNFKRIIIQRFISTLLDLQNNCNKLKDQSVKKETRTIAASESLDKGVSNGYFDLSGIRANFSGIRADLLLSELICLLSDQNCLVSKQIDLV